MNNKTKTFRKIANASFALFLFALLAASQNANAALQAAGPLSTVHGFPTWYQDTTGLALQPCLGINTDGTGTADPNCVLPLLGEEPNFNPAISTSFPDNFPSEFFYYIGDAGPINVGTAGAKAKFRMALEGAFASLDGSPAAGQQIAFLRINFAVNKVGGTNGLTPNSTYTINHPYGSFTVTTDALGDIIAAGGADFRAEDGAFTPPLTTATSVSFLAAVNTNIGPFLRAVAPAAPAGYIGNPNITQTIQAGPGGAAFTINGPNIDGLGGNTVSTDQWALAGKIAVIDTVAPTIVSVTPSSAALGSTNVVARANITDNLGATSATIDLGSLGSNLSATLNGSQEVPPIGSTATGSGTFTIDTVANTLSFNINFSGLPAGDIEATPHIHNAAAGVNGPIVFDLPVGTSKIGVWNYPETLEAEILAGRTYAQIHSVLFPAGAIRGQILPNANIQNMILTAGTKTDGTWSVIIPGALSRLGTFNLPIVVSDGSNTANGTLALTVNVLTSVSVTPPAASIAIGATQQLTASPLDENGGAFTGATITWSSSNNGVATVTNTGLVTAVAPGNATITATAIGGGVTVLGNSTITVAPVAPVFTSISVTPPTGSAAIGGTLQLTATALDQAGIAMIPQPAITWALVNPADVAIATVSATGLVTGVSAGGPIAITATSGLISGNSSITVSAAPVCQTTADTNLDGAISIAEIVSHVRAWKAGSVSIAEIVSAVRFWKAGTGC